MNTIPIYSVKRKRKHTLRKNSEYRFNSFEEFLRTLSAVDEKNKARWARRIPREKLFLRNDSHRTVIQEIARQGLFHHALLEEKILRMKDDRESSVFEEAIENNAIPEEYLTEKLLLTCVGYEDKLFAHYLADSGKYPRRFMTPKFLSLGETEGGRTIAHILAMSDWLPEDLLTEDVLMIRSPDTYWGYGETVAAAIASMGKIPPHLMFPPVAFPARAQEQGVLSNRSPLFLAAQFMVRYLAGYTKNDSFFPEISRYYYEEEMTKHNAEHIRDYLRKIPSETLPMLDRIVRNGTEKDLYAHGIEKSVQNIFRELVSETVEYHKLRDIEDLMEGDPEDPPVFAADERLYY